MFNPDHTSSVVSNPPPPIHLRVHVLRGASTNDQAANFRMVMSAAEQTERDLEVHDRSPPIPCFQSVDVYHHSIPAVQTGCPFHSLQLNPAGRDDWTFFNSWLWSGLGGFGFLNRWMQSQLRPGSSSTHNFLTQVQPVPDPVERLDYGRVFVSSDYSVNGTFSPYWNGPAF